MTWHFIQLITVHIMMQRIRPIELKQINTHLFLRCMRDPRSHLQSHRCSRDVEQNIIGATCVARMSREVVFLHMCVTLASTPFVKIVDTPQLMRRTIGLSQQRLQNYHTNSRLKGHRAHIASWCHVRVEFQLGTMTQSILKVV